MKRHVRRALHAGLVSALLCAGPSAAIPSSGRELRTADPAEIASLAASARPGDTIILTDGTYTDADILLVGEGQPGLPITLRTETPGKVVLTGASRLRLAGRYLVVDGLWFKDGGFDAAQADAFEHVIAFEVEGEAPTAPPATSR